jgi:hypothetical protein
LSVSVLDRKLPITVSGLAKVAIYTTNVDAEKQTLINQKCTYSTVKVNHLFRSKVGSSSILVITYKPVKLYYRNMHVELCVAFFIFLKGQEIFLKTIFSLRWLCKFFEKALA